MKILITTFTYPPNADGCAMAAAVLAEGLAARGHQVTVITETHPQRISDSPNANPRIVQFKISGSANWRIGVQGEPRERAAYEKFLRDFSGDAIIFENWDSWPTYLAEPWLEKIKPRKILVSHGYTPHIWSFWPNFPWGVTYWLGGWPLFLRTPFLMRKFDEIIFLSAQRDFGRFLDVEIARLTNFKNFSIIPNGAFPQQFDQERLPNFRKEFRINSELLLLCVANYCERKNQMLAVRAFRRARLKNATLVFIGSEFNAYARQAQELNSKLKKDFPAGEILFLEKLSRSQTCAAYQAADFFVLSAKAETQPIVLLEAMASRTPWISTHTGCVSELPGGIVAHSENQMVEKIRMLAASPQMREKLSAEGWAACQKIYDWEKVVAAYDEMLKCIIRQK